MSIAPVTIIRSAEEDSSRLSRFRPLALLRQVDWIMAIAALAIAAWGYIVLKGATEHAAGLAGTADRQLLFTGVAFCAMIAACAVDYRWINRVGMALYVFNLVALVYLVYLKMNTGVARWINLGPVNWQPAETMKLATAVVCAQWLALHTEKLESWRSIFVPGVICGLPALLVLVQPDLGTAAVFFIMFLAMMLMAGVNRRKLAVIIAAAPIGMAAMFPFLKGYQKARLITFLNPEADPQGTGYNVIQSKVAVGSGGVFGQGWGEGTQSIHRFLPEHHTDFIFASMIEQFGLLGGLLLLAGYLFVLWRMFQAMDNARDRFGGVLVAGLIAIFFGHIAINAGMNIGLLPVTGLPLPLISYGGSFQVTVFILIGLVLNVASRRYTFVGP